MRLLSRSLVLPLLFVWGSCPPHAAAQTVVANIPDGGVPRVVAVNPVTNKIYVANCNINIDKGYFPSSITVIDGATNSATSLPGTCPAALAVNTVTNKIYFPGGVIDGATNSITNFPEPLLSAAYITGAAVNPITNKIYIGGGGGVTVIDGATNSETTVTDPNASGSARSIAVNSVTNKIYVANYATGAPGNVTVIDGATNAITTVTDPNALGTVSIAVNSVTNKIYVANQGDIQLGNITVIDGATNNITTLTDPNVAAPNSVAVNETTNTIYVANANNPSGNGIGGVTVINGATNSISTLTDPNAFFPFALAVDSATNMIYVSNSGNNQYGCDRSCAPGSVTVINGATNAVATIIVPVGPIMINSIAINSVTDTIYDANFGNVTVINGGAVPASHLLLVQLAGSGTGTVTSIPAGINCTASCSASFAAGTAVHLTASPASGVTFSGWSTNCTGTGACDLMMTSDDFVTATFTNDTAPDFSIQTASSAIIQPGSQATEVVTIAPVGGTSYGSAVQLSCAVAFQLGAPITNNGPMPTCAVSPSSVTPGANSVSSTLTITAPRQSGQLMPFREGQPSKPLFAVFLPIPFALIGLRVANSKPPNRRRSLSLLCGIFIAFVALQAGCGGGSSSGGSGGGQQPQNYTVTVSATSGAILHTAQVIVVVP